MSGRPGMSGPYIPLPSSVQLPRMTSALWIAFVTVIAIALGIGSVAAPVLVTVAAGGCVLVAVLWGRPRVAMTAWILSIAMLPCWIGMSMAVYVLPIQSIIAFIAIIVTKGKWSYKPTKWDVYSGIFLLVTLVAVLFCGSSRGAWATLVFEWGLSFLFARVLISGAGTGFAINTMAVIFSLVGGFALLELLLTWHLFAAWPKMNNFQYLVWGNFVQTRDGADRSFWAFGHPIALGGALALSIPFVWRSTYARTVRAVMLALVFSGILASASRGALITGVFALTLCGISAVRTSTARAASFVLASSVAVIIQPVLRTFAAGQTTEERVSSNYRSHIYAMYTGQISLFGKSPMVLAPGLVNGAPPVPGHPARSSIDSTVLGLGLQFGWIAVAMLIIPLIVSVFRIITGRASIAELSIVGQVPLLAFVALITQWQSLVFFVFGFALQMAIETKARDAAQASSAARESAISTGSATEGRLRTLSAAGAGVSLRINGREDLL
jgi:hypothetical protein